MVEKSSHYFIEVNRATVEQQALELSVSRLCDLLGLNHTRLYDTPAQDSALNLGLMRLIDAQYLKTPFYGYRRMTVCLRDQGRVVNLKRVQRLAHALPVTCLNQVLSTDITYTPV